MLIWAFLVRKCSIESFLDCSTGNPFADPESFLRGALSFDDFFVCFFMRGGRIQIPLLAGHERPAGETPFKWRFAGGPIMAQLGSFVVLRGSGPVLLKNPIFFVIFQVDPDPLSAHVIYV